MSRPDGILDLLGLKVLDQPAAVQSDPTVLSVLESRTSPGLKGMLEYADADVILSQGPVLCLQVSRPDGKPDLLGLKVLDEPAAVQSDPSILTMQLRQASKQASSVLSKGKQRDSILKHGYGQPSD